MANKKKVRSQSFLNVSLPRPIKKSTQIFVAYSYKAYPSEDYRKSFKDLEKAFNVKFVFADEKITNLHILQKILEYIRESRFSIFDISGWNPNVTLELGIALGMNERAFIAINPSKTDIDEVPSDLRGVDRVEYTSYTKLEEGLKKLLLQELPPLQEPSADDYLINMGKQIVSIVNKSDGIGVAAIAQILGVSTDIVKVAIKPLIDMKVQARGRKRGTRYYKK